MTSTPAFEDLDLNEATFQNVALANAQFRDVNLSEAVFENVRLAGAHFRDVSLQNARITDCRIDGLTILGFDVMALITAEQERQKRLEEASDK
ncbi:MAG: pentapeptide repeat-containing protein [Cytophagales bacterium]|nr:pentapeptide repeat-containing protein [Armatimonadota bacterium]